MQTSSGVGGRLLEILRRGVSTRNHAEVLPEMAETVEIAKSSVRREFMEAGEKALKEPAERSFEGKDLLILYLDGLILGGHHVVAALGGLGLPGLGEVLPPTDGLPIPARREMLQAYLDESKGEETVDQQHKVG